MALCVHTFLLPTFPTQLLYDFQRVERHLNKYAAIQICVHISKQVSYRDWVALHL